MTSKKKRADVLLVENGYVNTRSQAQKLIFARKVKVNSNYVEKPSALYEANTDFEIVESLPYVSRGGLKLESALDYFNINVENKIALDIGASTGGFTDCLLQRGAARVYSVDVGYGQLDYKLRTNNRVICLEKLNARYLSFEHIPEKVDIITIDVSFISIIKLLPVLIKFLRSDAIILPMVKPQFELSKQEVKKGVVRKEALQMKAVKKIIDFGRKIGLYDKGIVKSKLKGPKGNQEYFVLFTYIRDS